MLKRFFAINASNMAPETRNSLSGSSVPTCGAPYVGVVKRDGARGGPLGPSVTITSLDA